MEKEERDKEMKVEVDRLWQHYFAESGGKIRSKAEAREGGTTRRSVRKMQTKAAAEQAASTQEQADGTRARAALSSRRGWQMRGRAATGARSAL